MRSAVYSPALVLVRVRAVPGVRGESYLLPNGAPGTGDTATQGGSVVVV